MPKSPVILSGTASHSLAHRVASNLGLSLGNIEVKKFSDQETYVNIKEPVKGKKVFVIQSGCSPANENFMELLLTLDALKRLSPDEIVAILPFYPYRRQERKVEDGESISAELVANLIKTTGADKAITVNLHSTTIERYFKIPLVHLTAWPVFINYFKKNITNIKDFVVVAPDEGSIHHSKIFSREFKIPLAILPKSRPAHDQVEIETIIGDVKGKNIIIADDEINTAGTMVTAISTIKQAGAKNIYLACIHPVLSGKAITRLKNAPIKKILITDTIYLPPEKKLRNMEIISVAPLISKSIESSL